MKLIASIVLAAAVAGAMACGEPAGSTCEDVGPVTLNEMPDLDLAVGDTAKTSLLEAPYFGRVCSLLTELRFEAQSADPAAVAVSVSDSILTTVAVGVADSVRVNVIAIATAGNSPPHEFLVSVRAGVGR